MAYIRCAECENPIRHKELYLQRPTGLVFHTGSCAPQPASFHDYIDLPARYVRDVRIITGVNDPCLDLCRAVQMVYDKLNIAPSAAEPRKIELMFWGGERGCNEAVYYNFGLSMQQTRQILSVYRVDKSNPALKRVVAFRDLPNGASLKDLPDELSDLATGGFPATECEMRQLDRQMKKVIRSCKEHPDLV